MKSTPDIIPITKAIPGIKIEKTITRIPRTKALMSAKIDPKPINKTRTEKTIARIAQTAWVLKPPTKNQLSSIMPPINPRILKTIPNIPAIIARTSATRYKLVLRAK